MGPTLTFFDILERETTKSIAIQQQRLNSGEINEKEFEENYESIMDERRLSINNILMHGYN